MTDSMDLTQESQALSTETSQQPPVVPPILNPPIPIASPTPPPNPQLQIKHLDIRKIPKPAIPSNRLVPDRTSQRDGFNSDNANTFFSEELAEIIVIRQSRECA